VGGGGSTSVHNSSPISRGEGGGRDVLVDEDPGGVARLQGVGRLLEVVRPEQAGATPSNASASSASIRSRSTMSRPPRDRLIVGTRARPPGDSLGVMSSVRTRTYVSDGSDDVVVSPARRSPP
jgi:hypothetical protein